MYGKTVCIKYINFNILSNHELNFNARKKIIKIYFVHKEIVKSTFLTNPKLEVNKIFIVKGCKTAREWKDEYSDLRTLYNF